jgi:hypothetical protein
VVVMMLFLILFVSKSITLFGKTNPSLTMQTVNIDFDESTEAFILSSKDFMFAVTDIPSNLGRIESVMIDTNSGTETVLPMLSCQAIAETRQKDIDPVKRKFFSNKVF